MIIRAIESDRLPEQRLYAITIEREGRTRARQRHDAAHVEVWAFNMYDALKKALEYLAWQETEPRLGADPLDVKIPQTIPGKVIR